MQKDSLIKWGWFCLIGKLRKTIIWGIDPQFIVFYNVTSHIGKYYTVLARSTHRFIFVAVCFNNLINLFAFNVCDCSLTDCELTLQFQFLVVFFISHSFPPLMRVSRVQTHGSLILSHWWYNLGYSVNVCVWIASAWDLCCASLMMLLKDYLLIKPYCYGQQFT